MGNPTKIQGSVRLLALVLFVNSRMCLGEVPDDDETAYEFKNDHPNIVEGDIMVDADHPGGATIALTTPKLWPNGRVPYAIDVGGNLPAKIQEAIQEWESKTCIRFEKRTMANCGYGCLRFEPGSGCYAGVGMAYRGPSGIGLGQGCSRGNVIHEIGHALGLHHEQARMDRDRYVTVHTDRLQPQYLHAFDKLSNKDIGEYDYGSIMHYPASAFSRNGQDTITKNEAYLRTNPAARNIRMGQRSALSAADIYTVKVMYKCGGTAPRPPTTPATRPPPVFTRPPRTRAPPVATRRPATPPSYPNSCSNTCYGRSCNYWVANTYKCMDLERAHKCDCSNCGACEAQYHQWKGRQTRTNAPRPRYTPPPSRGGRCYTKCFGRDCDYWVANTYTCTYLKAVGCNCAGCAKCG